jgi:hypothetical protein
MDNQAELVRQILTSERFLNASEDEQNQVLAQIQASGVPVETIDQIQEEIDQEEIDQNEIPEKLEPSQEAGEKANFLETVPYDVFVSLVRKGEIAGRDLINVCQLSSTIHGYCNRSLELPNGQIVTKYLFRQLLQDAGIEYSADQDPQRVYIQYSKYHGFSTAALLELAAQILQNQIYVLADPTGRHVVRKNLSQELRAQFPGLQLPVRVSKRVLQDLSHARWISGQRAENPFSVITDQGSQIENFRPAIYDFVVSNLSLLVDQNLWPLSYTPGGSMMPNTAFAHNLIFTGTGVSRQRIGREGFNAWLQAFLAILQITDRNRSGINKLTKK